MAAISSSNTAFALDLLRTLSQENPTGNIFVSPLSISSALAMVYLGAKGDTASQMAQVSTLSLLHAPLPSPDTPVIKSNKVIKSSICSHPSEVQLTIGVYLGTEWKVLYVFRQVKSNKCTLNPRNGSETSKVCFKAEGCKNWQLDIELQFHSWNLFYCWKGTVNTQSIVLYLINDFRAASCSCRLMINEYTTAYRNIEIHYMVKNITNNLGCS